MKTECVSVLSIMDSANDSCYSSKQYQTCSTSGFMVSIVGAMLTYKTYATAYRRGQTLGNIRRM